MDCGRVENDTTHGVSNQDTSSKQQDENPAGQKGRHGTQGCACNTDGEATVNGERTPPPGYSEAMGLSDTESKIPVDELTDKLEQEVDPWGLVEWKDVGPKFSELPTSGKIKRVCLNLFRFVVVVFLLYMFICSLDILGAAFQLLGGRTAGAAFTRSEILQNPVAGLMIGVVVTVLLQSSSTSTSIIVTMVASGILPVQMAIPIIMGANIGTSVTNTLVAMGQIASVDEFRRAFAGATVHDAFNWLSVLVLLPLEAATGMLFKLTDLMVDGIEQPVDSTNPQFLKVITSPLTDMIIKIDKNVITYIAKDDIRQKRPLVRYYCKNVDGDFGTNFPLGETNETYVNHVESEMIWTYNLQYNNVTENVTEPYTEFTWNDILDVNSTKCSHAFVGSGLPGSSLSETSVGLILLFGSLTVLCLSLIIMVKTLQALMKGPMASLIRKTVNASFPGKLSFLTGYVAILVGAGLTILVQSSSVFTSAVTPLVGMGVLTVERMYPLTLGSNIGTTITGMLAALTADADTFQDSLQIALCHLFFNIIGILIFYPIPILRRLPLRFAKFLGNTTAKYRWFALAYLICMFFVMPALVFALSIPGWEVLVCVLIPIVILVILIVTLNIMQNKCKNKLPQKLQTWEFLPLPCRSLSPYDVICRKACGCCKICQSEQTEPEAVRVDNGNLQPISDGKLDHVYDNKTFVNDTTEDARL